MNDQLNGLFMSPSSNDSGAPPAKKRRGRPPKVKPVDVDPGLRAAIEAASKLETSEPASASMTHPDPPKGPVGTVVSAKDIAINADQVASSAHTKTSPSPPSPRQIMREVLLRAMTDTTIDLDRAQKIIGIEEEMALRDAEVAFNRAMVAAQAEIKPIAKKTLNDRTGSKYANLETLHAEMKPILSKNGFGLTSSMEESRPNHITIVCTVLHATDASSFQKVYRGEFPIDGPTGGGSHKNPPTGQKTALQSTGTSITYARRYLEMMIFDVTVADDTDGNPPIEDKTVTIKDEIPHMEPPDPNAPIVEPDPDAPVAEVMNDAEYDRVIGHIKMELEGVKGEDARGEIYISYESDLDRMTDSQRSRAEKLFE